jgi:hypothetical protein
MRNAFWIVSILAAILCVQAVAKAQDTASVTGIVTDTTGAVIPEANVRLENPATSVAYNAVTNAVGSYTVANVAPGPGYQLTITREGFKPVVISGIYLNIDATRTQNVKMSVGTTTETVEVSASSESETLNTSDATVGNNFEVSMLNDLPVQNRDSPAALFYQQPGVTLDGSGDQGGSVTGARTDQSNVTLDGLEMNDEATGGFGVIVGNAPVDSVQEFRGVTADPLSSAGQGGGGQFELVTKGGTNQFHGDLAEYHRDTDTEANSWFNDNTNPVTPTPPLVRNQFGGGVGGPIWRNKAYFYFDYNGRRDAISTIEDRTVPLDSYRNGQIRYITNTGAIATLPSAKEFDPKGIGFDQAESTLFNQRFPHANDLTGDVGDLVNTAGYRFNAPTPLKEDDYVQRVDYNLTGKMKIDGVGHFTRRNDEYGQIQFPGDPQTFPRLDRSYSWVANHTWTISNNKLNQASFGETHEDLDFPVAFNPQGVNVYGYAGLSGPYAGGNNAQARTYPIPIVRDDFSWERGRHSLVLGGTFKWESPQSFQAENYYFPNVGVTGNTNFTALSPSLRPKDIGSSNEATTIYDDLYSTALGALASVGANFNYNNKGQELSQGSGLHTDYRYYETEIYAGDTWKVTPDFTLSYGLRYQGYTTPYEIHGNQSVSDIGSFDSYFDARVKQSQSGIEGNSAIPLISWSLGGKANNGKPFYQPFDKNFAPRMAFAYNPGFDKKTVFSGGGGVIYDHSVVNALIFQELQTSYLFEASNTNLFGASGNPTATLQTAPRFGGLSSQPPPPSVPNVTPPFFPFVAGNPSAGKGIPYGLALGEANLNVDPNLKIPYNIEYNFGMQHEFPQGYLFKIGYVGRLGRRLLAQADGSQLIEFPDNTGKSNQTMSQAMGGLTTQLRANAGLGPLGAIEAVKPEPWFEDVVAPGVGAANGFASNTELIAYEAFPYPQRGDFADTMYVLAALGILPPNVGLASQFGSQQIFTNKGFSNYNGMLVTLHKNAGYGLQFDLNYTWSHSIDNVSEIANYLAVNTGYGWICDVLRPRECRGNSDFDATNYFNGNFIYDLPVGRGKAIGANAPFWVNEAIGGWEIGGIPTWHTGYPWTPFSNAFVAGFATDAPATLIGSKAQLQTHINGGKGQPLSIFSNQTTALADFTGPTGFAIGGRNSLRGPGFFNLDLGLGKTFPIYEDKVNLKFRVDAFNALNHPNFNAPGSSGSDITQSEGIPFGTISSTDIPPSSDQAARVLQGALRLEF